MENFRETLKKRLRLVWAAAALAALLYSMLLLLVLPGLETNAHSTSYLSGFSMGLFCGVMAVLLKCVLQYSRALKNDEKLKELHIKENDERRKFIQTQIGGVGFYVIAYAVALATVAACFINETVFYTLIGVLMFIALVKTALKAIFSKKY